MRTIALTVLLGTLLPGLSQVLAQGFRDSFFPGGTYRADILTPDSVLGHPLGSSPSRYDDVVRYLQTLAAQSPRVRIEPTGKTHEGRTLWLVVLTSEENHRKMDEIRSAVARLADPSRTSAGEAQTLARTTPAVVWIGHSIHGDELSGVDAALRTCYQLAAGTDDSTLAILRDLVVCVDPMQNPDGRERWLAQMTSWAGEVPSDDAQSLAHTGMWPYGRGNHYLFDMNRDWLYLVHPESRARVRVVRSWNPQVMIDAHEMGAYDTYLFSPAREPIHPQISPTAMKWWQTFATDQARAFDRYGWSYYTREWSDEWYPGYGSSYGLFIGAVGILYEQAGVDGSPVKRPDGRTLSYRGAVHRQFTSTMANLLTARRNRVSLLEDYAASRRESAKLQPGRPAVFYCVAASNRTRLDRLAETLNLHGIRVETADTEFRVGSMVDGSGTTVRNRSLPAGSLVIPLDQPLGRLAQAILDFDPRMNTSFLQEERKALEKDRDSKVYDVTAWSLPLAFGLEAYWSNQPPRVPSSPWNPPAVRGSVELVANPYGFMIDGTDDRSVIALARMLSSGLTVRAGREPVTVEGHQFDRGALLLRAEENPPALPGLLSAIAESTGVRFRAVGTALSTKGPDLGGNDFVLLREPRIALVAGPEVGSTGFGSLWYTIDKRLGMKLSLLSMASLGAFDLRKYNVLLLPGAGSPASLRRVLGKAGIGTLRSWVEAGGTLIAVGSGAAFLADTATGLSKVRLRRQALKELAAYNRAAALERAATKPEVDSTRIWEGSWWKEDSTLRTDEGKPDEQLVTQEDERGQLFMPRGAILRVELDTDSWLAYGMGDNVPALLFSSYAFLSRYPVQTPARFAAADRLRLSGLLWPEAGRRWASSAYVTREPLGAGQTILFAGEPTFRGGFPGTERLLLNALLLGPGFGTRTMVEW